MSKILIAGLCPLPFENSRSSFGPGIRTWQLAHSLRSAGHEVEIIALRVASAYGNTTAEAEEIVDGITVERWEDRRYFTPGTLQERIRQTSPDAVVGATIYGSNVLALAEPDVPFWADQFGCVMAEAQAKAYLESKNWPLDHFWTLLRPILERADRISVVSERQRYALIGELGVAGRLTWETCGYDFTAVLPCAAVPPSSWPLRPMLRGGQMPQGAFVVLWSGGYNVWSDVDTLFEGLEAAIAERPEIHFVSTGGAIGGHDEKTYRRFCQRIAGSTRAANYHLQGWVLAEDVASFVAEADLGVVTEIPIYEGLLGSKNRVVQWMAQGLPVLYNRVGDLGDLLADAELGLTFPARDARALTERLIWAAGHRDEVGRMAEAARSYSSENLTFASTCRELLRWAEAPSKAPGARQGHAALAATSAPPPPEEPPAEVRPAMARRAARLLRRQWRRLAS